MQKKCLLIAGLFTLAFLSCTVKNTVVSGKDVSSAYFTTGRQQSQFFEIHTDKDTVLISAAGMKITIPAGAIQGSNSMVRLEIKEAFTIEAMVAAGLTTTTTDGRPLSSNGMFYINVAAGQQAKLVKAVTINTPSNEFNPNAKLYNGVEKDGSISWQNPKSVLENGALNELAIGKQLFENCASCHKIDKDLTGPALLHVTKRLPRQWLYDYTRNTNEVMASGDCYANALFLKWNKVAMSQFPVLDSLEMKYLYDYIDQESNRIEPGSAYEIPEAMPKCEEYYKAMNELQAKRDAVKIDNGSMAEVTQVQPANSSNRDNYGEPLKVAPDNYDAINYQFTVEAFGWYNIDILLADEATNIISMLRIQVAYELKASYNTFLLIPKRKIFERGGPLKDTAYEGFYNIDGTIPLPQNETCIVFAVGETEDGKPVFGKLEFRAAKSQTLTLQMQAYTEVEVRKQLSLVYRADGFTTEVLQTQSFKEISAIDTAIDSLKAKWDSKCDCFGGADSARRPAATTPDFLILKK